MMGLTEIAAFTGLIFFESIVGLLAIICDAVMSFFVKYRPMLVNGFYSK